MMIDDPSAPEIQDFFSLTREDLRQSVDSTSAGVELFICPPRNAQLVFVKGDNVYWEVDKNDNSKAQRKTLLHPLSEEFDAVAKCKAVQIPSSLDSIIVFMYYSEGNPHYSLIELGQQGISALKQLLEQTGEKYSWLEELIDENDN